MRPYMYEAYQSSFNIKKYFIFLKTTQLVHVQNMQARVIVLVHHISCHSSGFIEISLTGLFIEQTRFIVLYKCS